MDTKTAFRALRHHLGESQQTFAVRLGLAIRTVARYETTVRHPRLPLLVKLAKLANRSGRLDLELVFTKALAKQIGVKGIYLDYTG